MHEQTLTVHLSDIPPITARKPGQKVTCRDSHGTPYHATILHIAGSYVLTIRIEGLQPLPGQRVRQTRDTALVDRFTALGDHAVKTYTLTA